MTVSIITLLSVAILSFVFLILVQKSKLKDLSDKNRGLSEFENMYREALLEKTLLAERCSKLQEIEAKYEILQDKYLELEKEAVRLSSNLEQERRVVSEKMMLLEKAEEKLSNTFKAISADALSRNNQSFLDLARTVFAQLQEKTRSDFELNTKSMGDLVNPIKNALEGVGNKLGELEKSRIGAYESLKQQVNDLISSNNLLNKTTHNLVSAFKAPTVRGRWGEIQLRRVVELSGMMEHCDFDEQVSTRGEEANIRPDMVIHYPGNKQIIVDAKVPLSAYLEAMETNDDNKRKQLMKEHAKQIKSHIFNLSGKEYWAQFQQTSPEFVIMFLPGEIFFSSAMEQDPSLFEFSLEKHVVIATPSTLLALLHTIAFGWRQQNLSDSADQIIEMGRELYKRLSDMASHISNLGKHIRSTVDAYNQTVANVESRVLVTARKIDALETSNTNIVELKSIQQDIREIKNKVDTIRKI